MLIANVVIYIIRNILTIIFFISASQINAEEIWYESFTTPEKGIWGDDDGITIHSDFKGITNWHLEYGSITVSSPDDYAKTVSTSGGRFEVRDVEGEITWLSRWIDIKGLSNITIQLTAYETGSGANTSSKYLKAYFRINGNEKIEFSENGNNLGNWGKTIAKQNGLGGDSLQIVVVMSNSYSADKVTLDEIIVTGDNEDTLPPFITDVKIQNADSLNIFFNEPVSEPITANNFELYSENENIPILSVTGNNSNFILKIEPSESFNLTLIALNIKDISGNISEVDTFKFMYFPPIDEHDIIINEIMADPNPPQGLPNVEYIELYNNAGFPVNLKNNRLRVYENIKKLEESVLLPGSFLILCSTSASDTLSYYGEVQAVKSFPSLRNSGAAISIISENELLIDSIFYTEEWGKNENKKDGGWSLERIDPNRYCGQFENWLFSQNSMGGTPGFENSVKSVNPDTEAPWLIEIEALNSLEVRIKFNEILNALQLKNTNNFYINEGVEYPDSIHFQTNNNITLSFSNPLSENKKYTIQLSNLADECGNLLLENSADFTWTVARKGDLVINEILSNPFDEGTDFIELFNHSEKELHLDHLWISNGKDTVQLKSISEQEIILLPSDYLVCTKDSAKVVNSYFSSAPEKIIETEKFPTIYNSEGSVIIINQQNEVTDHFIYTEQLHSPVLADIKGVSLERFSFSAESNEPANWHSAAASVGFATPGLKNSQAEKDAKNSIVFEPEAFSPNLDGYNDEYKISYSFNKPGYIANCRIFDAAGRFIFQLAQNEILATDGFLVWNGEDKTGQKLPLGVYVVLFETFDFDGNINRFKDAVVLTDSFD